MAMFEKSSKLKLREIEQCNGFKMMSFHMKVCVINLMENETMVAHINLEGPNNLA
jgi:hypothetical protein